jgi:hypothetical protein
MTETEHPHQHHDDAPRDHADSTDTAFQTTAAVLNPRMLLTSPTYICGLVMGVAIVTGGLAGGLAGGFRQIIPTAFEIGSVAFFGIGGAFATASVVIPFYLSRTFLIKGPWHAIHLLARKVPWAAKVNEWGQDSSFSYPNTRGLNKITSTAGAVGLVIGAIWGFNQAQKAEAWASRVQAKAMQEIIDVTREVKGMWNSVAPESWKLSSNGDFIMHHNGATIRLAAKHANVVRPGMVRHVSSPAQAKKAEPA